MSSEKDGASPRDKAMGVFVGIAVGDSLGLPYETMTAQEVAQQGDITHYREPKDNKYFTGCPAGTTSDDTQMSGVIRDSLIECKGFNMDNIAAKSVASLISEGDRGFGGSTREAFHRMLDQGIHWSESGKTDKPNRGAGNGVPMKIAPLALYHRAAKLLGVEGMNQTLQLSRMTHATDVGDEAALLHVAAVDACFRYYQKRLWQGFFTHGLRYSLTYIPGFGPCTHPKSECLGVRMAEMSVVDWSKESPESIRAKFGTKPFMVYDSLALTYAFFMRNPHSIETLYDIIRAGGDTDTNASIAGGLLGALNGMSVFPKHLVDGLVEKDRIMEAATRFCDTFNIK